MDGKGWGWVGAIICMLSAMGSMYLGRLLFDAHVEHEAQVRQMYECSTDTECMRLFGGDGSP